MEVSIASQPGSAATDYLTPSSRAKHALSNDDGFLRSTAGLVAVSLVCALLIGIAAFGLLGLGPRRRSVRERLEGFVTMPEPEVDKTWEWRVDQARARRGGEIACAHELVGRVQRRALCRTDQDARHPDHCFHGARHPSVDDAAGRGQRQRRDRSAGLRGAASGAILSDGKVRNIADQAKDAPYVDESCCAVLVNGKFLAKNPKAAAAATRALLKGAKWVETNPAAAARMSVEKKYLASNAEMNTIAIANLRYVPSVSGADDAVKSAAAEMKKAGMLSPTTDIEDLAKRAFVHLDGVTDEWLKTLQVEKLADGQIPPKLNYQKYAKMFLAQPDDPCCRTVMQ